MQDVNKYIDSFEAPTRGERLNMALISLLMDLNNKADELLPTKPITAPSASSEHIEASKKPKKKEVK